MPPKSGPIKQGHPYINVRVSADGKLAETYEALIDTGYSGFVSVPVTTASILGLQAHTTARYTLANGRLSDPVPLAYGFASLEGEGYLRGLIAISENTSVVVGMSFFTRSGKALILGSGGVVVMDEKEFVESVRVAARLEAEAAAAEEAAKKPKE